MVFWICLRYSIYHDFECIRNLNMLGFYRYINRVPIIHGFWICKSSKSILDKIIKITLTFKYSRENQNKKGKNKKSKMLELYVTWNLTYFSIFEQYSFPVAFRKNLRKYVPPTILSSKPPLFFSGVNSTTHSSMPPMSPMLAHHSPYPQLYATHTTHASMSQMWACHQCHPLYPC